MEEFEIKFLEIDVPELENKLVGIGAKKLWDFKQKSALFDYEDFRLDKNHSWIKLRTNGEIATLSYKQRIGVKSNDGSIPDDGMKEVEVVVDNFEKTLELFKSIGFIIKREMENRRIKYQKGDLIFDIDFWPMIPPYVEIESTSMEKVREVAKELNFDPEKGFVCSPDQIYMKYGFNLKGYISVTPRGAIKR